MFPECYVIRGVEWCCRTTTAATGAGIHIVIALDEMHSSTVLSLLVFFCEVTVGVGASVERDQSAPTQAVPLLNTVIILQGRLVCQYSSRIARPEQDAPSPNRHQ